MNQTPPPKSTLKSLPRNVWAVSLTSFFTDISSEMILNLLPLFLTNVLGVRTSVVGLIEGTAEATSSLLKVFSGWFSDRIGKRKGLAVLGYGLSALSKPFFYFASTWGVVAGVRWVDRVGKGIRTAPRDALVADSISPQQRGLAFGFHRAADTAGAMLGIGIALLAVWLSGDPADRLQGDTFRTVVLLSLIPAFLGLLFLVLGAKDVSVARRQPAPGFALFSLGRPFLVFLLLVGLFELGNSSDAFLILLAQERGLSVLGILGMLMTFNLVYTLISTPAGSLSDRLERRKLIAAGWLIYAFIYLGFARSTAGWQVWLFYAVYGAYYGLAYGTAKAMVADLVPAQSRGTAYGTYNAVLGLLDFPASIIAGILWQGVGGWRGWGPSAPFLFGAGTALVAAVSMYLWKPPPSLDDRRSQKPS